jgi:hypothetical protein
VSPAPPELLVSGGRSATALPSGPRLPERGGLLLQSGASWHPPGLRCGPLARGREPDGHAAAPPTVPERGRPFGRALQTALSGLVVAMPVTQPRPAGRSAGRSRSRSPRGVPVPDVDSIHEENTIEVPVDGALSAHCERYGATWMRSLLLLGRSEHELEDGARIDWYLVFCLAGNPPLLVHASVNSVGIYHGRPERILPGHTGEPRAPGQDASSRTAAPPHPGGRGMGRRFFRRL